jgi:hypothetical protein
MISQDGWRLCVMYGEIAKLGAMLHGMFIGIGKQVGPRHTSEQRELIGEIGDEVLANSLEFSVLEELRKLGLDTSAALTFRFICDLKSGDLNLDSRFQQLESIRHAIETELGKRKFAYIPVPQRQIL